MIDYIQINPNIKLPIIDEFNPFKAILVIDQEYSDKWQVAVSEWLVTSRCKYMFACGLSCSSWHDDEPLTEVFEFAKIVRHENYELSKTFIIHISNSSNKKSPIAEYEHA